MFSEFLKKDSYEIEFERIGVRTKITPLSEDELNECARLKGDGAARYALYLACPALHEEGERLFKEGRLFSPVDITDAVDLSDINAAYRYIKDISGMGESRVRLYKNEDTVSYEQPENMDEAPEGYESSSILEKPESQAEEGVSYGKGLQTGEKRAAEGGIALSKESFKYDGDIAIMTRLADGLKRAAENM